MITKSKIFPIANENLTVQILDLIEIASSFKLIKKGANEAVKNIKKGKVELLVLASDSDPIEIVLHLPLLCEDRSIPYIFINSKISIGKACGINRGIVACCIMESINLDLNKQIKCLKKRMELEFF
ncbi:SNU13 snRNP subunit homolog [Guillardia theta]|uniref:H/ACA ribonucleoprotein complex subunit 2 n=1 Tax=Guillardia theta TaxID=55529 RepID=Q9AW38_GUITH|nr:SNU13 snRNP subunit homolog [Guillardia theta]CAC27033.1 SNU13 snRNP subunit homolog [Guillardia theta]|mmetsp:Transcript_9258/g.30902  ORF Transcript_9258/g.30902 Transcript_9258/m.30902 type:complete len:126 (-) Transcript_9258:3852-4229(-)